MKFFFWLFFGLVWGTCVVAAGKESFNRRPVGIASYYFKSTEKDSRGVAGIEVFFRLMTMDDNSEILIIDSVRQKEKDGNAFVPYRPDEECKKQWMAEGSEVGRLRIDTFRSLKASVPACVPERILGSVTDILSFLFIQSKEEFELSSLKKAGQIVAFDGFSVKWSREPELLDAELNCPGGQTAYLRDSAGIAVFSWTPDPMNLTMLRVMSPGQTKFLMAGAEKFQLIIEVDKKTGVLVNAYSTIDELDLKVWMPLEEMTIGPQSREKIKEPGMPITITRELLLKKL